MDTMMKERSRKNLIKKRTSPCSSVLKRTSRVFVALGSLTKREPWSCRASSSTSICERKKNKARRVAPAGYFSVYVGPEKQRFVVKIGLANHPLFKLLLEEAALEYGYKNDGPLLLPCDVDLFHNVLAEIYGGQCSSGHDQPQQLELKKKFLRSSSCSSFRFKDEQGLRWCLYQSFLIN